MIPVGTRRISLASACLGLGLLSAIVPSARAQDGMPGMPAPQAVQPAPQATYAAPQAYSSGQYASPQAARPCACYYPQGYCPFPRGNCASFPRGNCVAVRPSPQWPSASSQMGSTPQATASPSEQGA